MEESKVWRKSSRCDTGTCVEVASNIPGQVSVRDGTVPDGPTLSFHPDQWSGFVDSLRQHRLTAVHPAIGATAAEATLRVA